MFDFEAEVEVEVEVQEIGTDISAGGNSLECVALG